MTKLLLVDDDEDILQAIKFFLQKNNFEVVTLCNATSVVETVLHFQPDMILMDINLQDYDGRNICRELRNQYQVSIPIILFSAVTEYASSVHDCGASGFIGKPFEVKTFANHLLSFME